MIETDTAAKELPEVAVAKFSGGATLVFERRKSLPLTVVWTAAVRRPSAADSARRFVALARRAARVDDERLDDPQQMLGQFVEIGVGEAEPRPVDVEAPHHRVREVQRDVGGHRLGVRVGPPGTMSRPMCLSSRQPLQRRRDGLGDGLGGIGDALQVRGQPVEEAARGMHGRGDEQRVGAGEVPVDRLPGDAERCGRRRRC